MLSKISGEMNDLKGAVEKQNKIFAKELREVATDSAERDKKLSDFVEKESSKVNEALTAKYDKLKYLLAKVLEESKKQLEKLEKTENELRDGITNSEKRITALNDNLTQMVQDTERKLEQDLGSRQIKLEDKLTIKMKDLKDQVEDVESKQIIDFKALKEAIETQTGIYNTKLDKLAELSETYHRNNFKNHQAIVEEIDNIKKALEVLDGELEEKWADFEERLRDSEARLINTINDEIVNRREGENQLVEEISLLTKKVDNNHKEALLQIKNNSSTSNQETKDLRQRIEKVSDDVEGVNTQLANISSVTQVRTIPSPINYNSNL